MYYLKQTLETLEMKVIAMEVMPDHIHLLAITLKNNLTIGTVITTRVYIRKIMVKQVNVLVVSM